MTVGNGGDHPTLREFVQAMMDERDRRYEERFRGQERAIAEKNVDMARRFENVNEFRGQLADQARTLMPRTEVEQRLKAMLEKIETVGALVGAAMPRSEGEQRIAVIAEKVETLSASDKFRGGRSSGLDATRVMIFAVLGVLTGFVGIAIALTR